MQEESEDIYAGCQSEKVVVILCNIMEASQGDMCVGCRCR